MIAFFPGQGSQHVGMGRAFFNEFALARHMFEEASDTLGINIADLAFEGPEDLLTRTDNAQPCILTVSSIAWAIAQAEYGIQPTLVAGHSLGEYSALVAAGALSFSDAIRFVRARGEAMNASSYGGMIAVIGLEDTLVEKACQHVHHDVRPANFNAASQVVVAGSDEALLLFEAHMKANHPQARLVRLAVSAPFHCHLMKEARASMQKIFSQAPAPKPLSCPIIPNATARLMQEPSAIYPLLLEQIDHPVLWRQSMELCVSKNPLRVFEFGPGKVLTGLWKRATKNIPIYSIGTPEDLAAIGKAT